MDFDSTIKLQTRAFQQAIDGGQDILAIRLFHEQTGASLKVAKDFVVELLKARDALRDKKAAEKGSEPLEIPKVNAARVASYKEFPRFELEDWFLEQFGPTWDEFQHFGTLVSRVARRQYGKGREAADAAFEQTARRLREMADQFAPVPE